MGAQSPDHSLPDLGEPSEASTRLDAELARLRRDEDSPLCLEQVRRDLSEEFEPRYQRALERFRPTVTHKRIGGLRCLVVEPRELKSDDVILHLFGGGFASGCPEYEMPIAAHLSAACGMKVVLPYYALAPEARYPIALRQVTSVYAALAEASSRKIFLTGESAGGGIALSLLVELESQGLKLPSAMLLFSPWVDMTKEGVAQGLENDPTISPELLEFFCQTYCDADDRKAISPAFFDFRFPLPPTYISTGSRDIMKPSLVAFHQSSMKKGHPSYVEGVGRNVACVRAL